MKLEMILMRGLFLFGSAGMLLCLGTILFGAQ